MTHTCTDCQCWIVAELKLNLSGCKLWLWTGTGVVTSRISVVESLKVYQQYYFKLGRVHNSFDIWNLSKNILKKYLALSVWQKLLSYFNTCISVECIVYHFDSTSLSSRSRSKACVTKGCKLSHERKEARIQTYFVWGRLNVHPISACWTGLNSVAIPLLKSQTNLLA